MERNGPGDKPLHRDLLSPLPSAQQFYTAPFLGNGAYHGEHEKAVAYPSRPPSDIPLLGTRDRFLPQYLPLVHGPQRRPVVQRTRTCRYRVPCRFGLEGAHQAFSYAGTLALVERASSIHTTAHIPPSRYRRCSCLLCYSGFGLRTGFSALSRQAVKRTIRAPAECSHTPAHGLTPHPAPLPRASRRASAFESSVPASHVESVDSHPFRRSRTWTTPALTPLSPRRCRRAARIARAEFLLSPTQALKSSSAWTIERPRCLLLQLSDRPYRIYPFSRDEGWLPYLLMAARLYVAAEERRAMGAAERYSSESSTDERRRAWRLYSYGLVGLGITMELERYQVARPGLAIPPSMAGNVLDLLGVTEEMGRGGLLAQETTLTTEDTGRSYYGAQIPRGLLPLDEWEPTCCPQFIGGDEQRYGPAQVLRKEDSAEEIRRYRNDSTKHTGLWVVLIVPVPPRSTSIHSCGTSSVANQTAERSPRKDRVESRQSSDTINPPGTCYRAAS
ncbi:hypothetical protein K438DRAFT_1942636 [Mycena galopus ATCC 62051]|nr:hypothetical protein K438DRAFT_1942636 [Mycena galopus ATCC 62051]